MCLAPSLCPSPFINGAGWISYPLQGVFGEWLGSDYLDIILFFNSMSVVLFSFSLLLYFLRHYRCLKKNVNLNIPSHFIKLSLLESYLVFIAIHGSCWKYNTTATVTFSQILATCHIVMWVLWHQEIGVLW